jgi:DNA-binding ferritin-like protein (Dps family)
MNNALVVKNKDGKEITINVIDIIEDTEKNKQFICYTIGDMEEEFISKLVETEDSVSLETVTEEERKEVEAVLGQDVEGE